MNASETPAVLEVRGEEVRDRLLRPGARRRHQRVLGDLAARAAGVLAHGLQRPALHPAADRDGVELGLERVEREQVADREEGQRHVLDAPLGRARDRDHRRGVDERGAQRVGLGEALGHARGDEPLGDLLPLPAAVGVGDLGRGGRQPLEPGAAGLDRLAEVAAQPSERYQRVTASTSASTPAISSTWTAGSTAPPERLDRLPVGLGAGHLACDPVGADDLGGRGAALGHELGDEDGAERVDDEVGVDGRDQLAPQRVLGQQVAEALDHGAAGSRRAGRARATGSSSSGESSSERLTRRLA